MCQYHFPCTSDISVNSLMSYDITRRLSRRASRRNISRRSLASSVVNLTEAQQVPDKPSRRSVRGGVQGCEFHPQTREYIRLAMATFLRTFSYDGILGLAGEEGAHALTVSLYPPPRLKLLVRPCCPSIFLSGPTEKNLRPLFSFKGGFP
jgi:hypothetical protein